MLAKRKGAKEKLQASIVVDVHASGMEWGALTQIWYSSLMSADQASLKRIKLSATLHLALHQLEHGDLRLGLSVGPR